MNTCILFTGMILFVGLPAGAQQRDTSRAPTRADSIAKATRDSIALMKELGAALAVPGSDTARQPSGPSQGGPTNPRLLPDISAVGDLLADLSPDGSTQPGGARFGVREVEVAIQSVVDPYFRGDVFLGFSDEEGVAIEQAFLTTTSLPNQLELKLGRFLMPFGKQNLTHRHDLHTIEYPYVIQRFFSDEGLKGTGLWGSRVFAPFGFFQEVQVTAIDRLGEPDEELVTAEPVNKSLGGLGFSARLRNYVDLSEAANVELSFSALTGKREQAKEPLVFDAGGNPVWPGGLNADIARETTLGADLTYRWRPLQQGIYQSFILQAEIMRRATSPRREGTMCVAGVCGPPWPNAVTGGYVFARYQTSQRTFAGARFDRVGRGVAPGASMEGGTLTAGSGYLEWFPSEFSKLIAAYEAVKPEGLRMTHRLLVQAAFSVGPHKPHPF